MGVAVILGEGAGFGRTRTQSPAWAALDTGRHTGASLKMPRIRTEHPAFLRPHIFENSFCSVLRRPWEVVRVGPLFLCVNLQLQVASWFSQASESHQSRGLHGPVLLRSFHKCSLSILCAGTYTFGKHFIIKLCPLVLAGRLIQDQASILDTPLQVLNFWLGPVNN